MSDPIRSISQNNYILATQQEVSHDNTLTGNGTPESPLGVANSSDETVLWENSSGSTSSVSLSESPYNFEFVDIYAGSRNGNVTTGPVVYRCSLINNPTLFCIGAGYINAGYPYDGAIKFTVSSSNISGQFSGSGFSVVIYKVVGVKRRPVSP